MTDKTNKYLTQAEEKARALPSAEHKDEPEKIRVVSAADVSPDVVRFLWNPYILRGDVTILAAAGGTGKTFAICGIIAELSNGRLPLNPFEKGVPVNTLFISAEDQAFIIRDRLEKAGADLRKVAIVDAMASVNLTLSDGRGKPDVSQLENLILETCRTNENLPDLIVIDPLHAIIGSEVKMTEQNVIRPFIQALANLAKRYNLAIIDVAHVSKRSAGNNANDAILGATDIVNAARSVLRVIFDETGTNPNRRVIVHTKSNYAKAGQSVAFEIDEDGALTWTEYSDVTKEDMENAARNNKSISEQMASKEASRISASYVSDQVEALANRQIEKKRFYAYRTLREYGINGKADITRCLGELNARGLAITFVDTPRHEKGSSRSDRGVEIIKI